MAEKRLRVAVREEMVRLQLSERKLYTTLYDAQPADLYPYKPGGQTVINDFLHGRNKDANMADCMRRWLANSKSAPTPKPGDHICVCACVCVCVLYVKLPSPIPRIAMVSCIVVVVVHDKHTAHGGTVAVSNFALLSWTRISRDHTVSSLTVVLSFFLFLFCFFFVYSEEEEEEEGGETAHNYHSSSSGDWSRRSCRRGSCTAVCTITTRW